MKILFITPTGGRTGSEMMLWYLIKHLSGSVIDAVLYARQKGELLAQSPIKATFSFPYNRNFLYNIYEGIYYKIFKKTPEEDYLIKLHRQHRPEMWYLNTLTMAHLAALARRLQVPYMVHVHELPQTFDDVKHDEFVAMMTGASQVIACSSIVGTRLGQLGLTNVVVLHSFIDHDLIQLKENRTDLRQKLAIPPDAFVWAMSGTLSLRKGYDMIPDLLNLLPPNAYLVWLGHGRDSGLRYYVEQRVAIEQLNFRMLGAKTEDYYDYLNIADGFALLSREDPFPLVMMEAAYLQKPIVGFESGGVSEFVQTGMGEVVEGFSIKKMAEAMQNIMTGHTTIDHEKLRQRSLEFGALNQINQWKAFFRP